MLSFIVKVVFFYFFPVPEIEKKMKSQHLIALGL